MDNREVVRVLNTVADLLDILGEDSFKAVAYRRAGNAIEHLREDLQVLHREGRLREIPGVGKALADKLAELLATGRLTYLDRLLEKLPPTVLELLEVPGVGPKTVGLLHRELGVHTVEDLEQAAAAGRVRTLPGLGPKREQAILEALTQMRERGRRFLLVEAVPVARALEIEVGAYPEVERAQTAGSLRRRRETTGDLDLVVATREPAKVSERLQKMDGIGEILAAGETKIFVRLTNGLEVDFRLVTPEQFASALVYFTGSKEHNIRLRGLAKKKGYRLNEYGFVDEDEKVYSPETEEELYRFLDLDWIPPELREDAGEIEAAAAGELPYLLELSDIKGDLHVHTHWSDGRASIGEMAAEAASLGYEYLVISDHSPSLVVANGLSPERVRQQAGVIQAANEEGGRPHLFQGSEVDILKDGSLDFPEEVLVALDFVTASIHSSFKRPREEQTARITGAMRSPHVDNMGHLTGRLLGRREGYQVDAEGCIRSARETGTLLEINASPWRLDIDDRTARRAKEAGVRISINTDGHSPEELHHMQYGVWQARRAWLTKDDVLNTRSLREVREFLQQEKSKRFGPIGIQGEE